MEAGVEGEVLRDDQREWLREFVPGGRKGKRGPRSDGRLFLDALLWLARSGGRWRDLPERFSSAVQAITYTALMRNKAAGLQSRLVETRGHVTRHPCDAMANAAHWWGGNRSANSMDVKPNAGPDVADWLASGAAFDARRETRRIDTHAASVFLNGDRAWKIKRPVRFSYLDFSTPTRRRAALEAELALNRRSAPEIYLAVHPIRLDRGALSIGGAGEAVDWILEMRRFPDDALLDQRADALDDSMLLQLADTIVALHDTAAPLATGEGAARLQQIIDGNLVSMRAFPALLDPTSALTLRDRQSELARRHAALLDSRALAGRIRHGHGDLHLRNIAIVDGAPVPFDCLEFDAELATSDVLYDLAFLLMDLWARNLRHAANLVLNRYLDVSATDDDGLRLLPLFMSVRAAIRAHVAAAGGSAEEAQRYLALAFSLLDGGGARVVAIGGLSGTGKTTLSRALGGDIGGPPGARILRSDVVRKRLAGVAPEERLPPAAYTPEAAAAAYAELARLAAGVLDGGHAVVGDAVFGEDAERALIEQVALQAGVPFSGFWLTLPEAGRIERIESRVADASDADARVARLQTAQIAPPRSGWQMVDAGGDAEPAVRAALGITR